MKAKSTIWSSRFASSRLLPLLIFAAAGWLAPAPAKADGFFVAPFVWNKKQDINEPSQKAIILYDALREDLILQVKYEGPAREFGWLIPAPNVPTVKKASMSCFYDLSRFTQEYMGLRSVWASVASLSAKPAKEEPVKVIEVKTVGAYDIAVLSPKDAGSLQNWLATNHFSYPTNQSEVLDSYIGQGWYFVAVKINLGGAGALPRPFGRHAPAPSDFSLRKQLASGELHPLQISFDSDRCIFPLKISSVNGQDAEVHLYLLSSKPLLEKGLFERELRAAGRERIEAARRREEEAARRYSARLEGEFDPLQVERALISQEEPRGAFWTCATGYHPHQQVSKKELPHCARQLDRMGGRKWWLDKYSMKFQATDMRDLVFEPALTVLSDKLADEEGYIAAVNLRQFKAESEPLLLAALEGSNAVARQNAADEIVHRYDPYYLETEIDAVLLRALLSRLNDPDAGVRAAAIAAASRCQDASLLEPIIQLGRDKDAHVRTEAVMAVGAMRSQASSNCVPLILKLLKDDNPQIVNTGLLMLQGLRAAIPLEDLLPLLKMPNRQVLLTLFAIRRTEPLSCEDARPLLENPMMAGRWLGLAVLFSSGSRQSVEMMIPMLQDRETQVRDRAYQMLCARTGKNDIPPEKPEQWAQWWEANKATFTAVQHPRLLPGPRSGQPRPGMQP